MTFQSWVQHSTTDLSPPVLHAGPQWFLEAITKEGQMRMIHNLICPVFDEASTCQSAVRHQTASGTSNSPCLSGTLLDRGLLSLGIYCLVIGLKCCLIVNCCPWVFTALWKDWGVAWYNNSGLLPLGIYCFVKGLRCGLKVQLLIFWNHFSNFADSVPNKFCFTETALHFDTALQVSILLMLLVYIQQLYIYMLLLPFIFPVAALKWIVLLVFLLT